MFKERFCPLNELPEQCVRRRGLVEHAKGELGSAFDFCLDEGFSALNQKLGENR